VTVKVRSTVTGTGAAVGVAGVVGAGLGDGDGLGFGLWLVVPLDRPELDGAAAGDLCGVVGVRRATGTGAISDEPGIGCASGGV
jgi:hypothetical protein